MVAQQLNQAAAEAGSWYEPLSKAAQNLLASLGPALDVLKSVNDLRNAIATWTNEVKGKVAARIGVLVSVLGMVAQQLNEAASQAGDWYDPLTKAAQNFLASLGPALDILKSVNDLRNAIATWTNDVKGKVAARIMVLVAVLGMVAQQLNAAAETAGSWYDPLTEAAQKFLASIGPALDILKATNDLRNAIATWTNEVKGKVAARIAVLVSVLGMVAQQLNAAAEQAGSWYDPLSEAAQQFLASIGPALDILKATNDLRNAIAVWTDEVKGRIGPRLSVLVSVLGMVAQARSDVEAGTAARLALDQDQQDRDGDQDQRDLCRALAVAQPVPGPVDRRRKGVDAVILHGAEVGQGLEKRQHHAGDDPGAGIGRIH
ncbi:MAG: hypothetical protein AABY13_03800, partial [Nanoarchaeota archaeon]